MIGQDLLRHRVTGDQTGDDRRTGDRGAADPAAVAEQRCERRMQVLATAFGEVAGQDPQQLVQVGAQRAVGRLLHAEVLEHRDAVRGGDAARRGAQQLLVDTAALARSRSTGTSRNTSRTGSAPLTCSARNASSQRFSWTSTAASAARHHASVPGRTRRWKSAIFAVSVITGSMTIIERAGSLAISLSTDARARETLRHPRVLADEHRHLGVLELAAGVAAVEVGVDPRLAGLLLRQRVGAVARTERLQERAAVGAAEVVALAAAAVVEDLVAAVGVGGCA